MAEGMGGFYYRGFKLRSTKLWWRVKASLGDAAWEAAEMFQTREDGPLAD